jgi:preprotein translocase subunit YajC
MSVALCHNTALIFGGSETGPSQEVTHHGFFHSKIMDFFIQSAYAQGAPQQGDAFGFLLPMLIIFGAFYFLLIRPQQKKQKAHTELISNLKSGDEILTAGGILGVITGISEHYAIVKIADNTEIKIQKSSVAQVVPKDTFDNA